MRKENLDRANKISSQIEDLNILHYICYDGWIYISKDKKNLTFLNPYRSMKYSGNDPELKEVIRAYCSRKIAELEKELETL